MAQIIRIEEFHGVRSKRPTPARRASDRDQQPRFFCTRCRCESFLLLTSGAVRCVNCSAAIGNVRVVMDPGGAAPDQ